MTSGSENEDESDAVSMAGDVSEYGVVPMAQYRDEKLKTSDTRNDR